MQVYGNTKLMGLLFMAHYQKLLLESSNPEDHKIAIQAVHPGMVASNMPNANHYNIPKFIGTIADKAIKLVGRCERCFTLRTWALQFVTDTRPDS